MRRTFIWSSYGLFWLAYCAQLLAQSLPTPTRTECGTLELTPAQALSLVQQGNLALQRKRAARVDFTAITYVPIRPHIINRSDGGGGFELASLNQVIAKTNRYYLLNGFGIQFYFAGTSPDYINDDNLYAQFPYGDGPSVDAYDEPNALNQYYTNFIVGGYGGFAYYPENSLRATRSVIGNASSSGNIESLGNYVIPHELGHNFNLIHTFGSSNGYALTDELVTRGAGANCTTAGDLLCDTPADPYTRNLSGINFLSTGSCPQYDPASSIRDANGDAYMPSLSNIMSYYTSCTFDFTLGQYDRMQAGLALRQSHTAYSLNFPATNVASPGNLSVSLQGLLIRLTWQDNATNEMGYFIERSTSSTTGFVSIGGVAPNETSFTDSRYDPNTQYYYRIRPSNTTTGSLSNIAVITTPVIPAVSGLTTSDISGSSAQVSWTSLGQGLPYDVQWRVVGSPTWNTLIAIIDSTTTLGNLLSNTAYEWQVKASANQIYSGPVSFTTTCPIPQNRSSSSLTRISASLSWNGNSDQRYTLQWRSVGSPEWTTVSNLTTTGYLLTGLTANTIYEWRIQGQCAGASPVSSDFTDPLSFTTLSCQTPLYPGVYNVYASSASFYWYNSNFDAGLTTEIRYRIVGTTNWTSVSSLTGTSYTLMGLTNNMSYEWQLRTVCSPIETSDYTTLGTFTTICRTPGNLISTATDRAATLSWATAVTTDPGTTYQIQYRSVGSTTWNAVSGLTSGTYSLTGLVSNVTYEWQVRTACTVNSQSDYSASNTFTTRCDAPNGLYASLITSTSTQLNWFLTIDPGTNYDLRYKLVGATDWTTVSNLAASSPTSSYTLLGLTTNTQYEWQLRTVCSLSESSTFTSGPVFTTSCQPPASLNGIPQVTSASLSWNQTGLDVNYEVRYRLLGTAGWITRSNLSGTSVSLTNLTGSTGYEYQVRTQCSDGAYSDFSSLYNFYTYACSPPNSVYMTNITTTSVQLNWTFFYANADTHYEGRYRMTGSSDWIVLDNLSSANGYGYIVLTGLTPATSYEWQIRTICSPTESSDFSSLTSFQTLPVCNSMYTLKTGFWTDTSVWSCGRIPLISDLVQLKHVVTIPPGYQAQVMRINYDAGTKLIVGLSGAVRFGQ